MKELDIHFHNQNTLEETAMLIGKNCFEVCLNILEKKLNKKKAEDNKNLHKKYSNL